MWHALAANGRLRTVRHRRGIIDPRCAGPRCGRRRLYWIAMNALAALPPRTDRLDADRERSRSRATCSPPRRRRSSRCRSGSATRSSPPSALILHCRGRVVVSGIGKSGHIGAQARRDAGVDRDAGVLRPSRRGLARRPRDDHRRRRRADAVELRRDRRTRAADAAHQAPGREASSRSPATSSRRSPRRPTSTSTPPSTPRPARWASRRPPARRRRWRWATRWRWRCWTRAASRSRISRARTPAARSVAGCSPACAT